MNGHIPPAEGADDIRAALNTRLRIAIDYAVRVMRSSDPDEAREAVGRLYDEVDKAKRLAERWSSSSVPKPSS